MRFGLLSSLCALAVIAAAGCARYGDDLDQEIAFDTLPSGGTCKAEREGEVLAAALRTPARLKVRRDKHHITVTCSLPGYATTGRVLVSDLAFDGRAAALLMYGLPVVLLDSVTGRDNVYRSNALIPLDPLQLRQTPQAVSQ